MFKRMSLLLAAILQFLVCPMMFALDLPCWDRADCFKERQDRSLGGGPFVEARPSWHKRLDYVFFTMRPDTDYSILFDSRKDRIPVIHTDASQRAVDELAGDVISETLSPLAYRIKIFTDLDAKKKAFNEALSGIAPEVRTNTYSVGIQPRVDLSRENPVSLDIRVRNGKELGAIFLRIHEAEAFIPLARGISARGGYSFRDSSWYASVSGTVILW